MNSTLRRSALAAVALVGLLALTGCAGQGAGMAGTKEGSNVGASPAAAPAPGETGFTEVPIGDPQDAEGMTVTAVYFQPVEMEPESGPSPDESDIHIEADVAAAQGNQVGFGVGEFVPYMTVDYVLTKKDTGETIEGSMMPMNASDGAHYGNNVKMLGAGNYELALQIVSPEKQGYLLHTDSETGVKGRFWKKPLELTYEFSYVPRKW